MIHLSYNGSRPIIVYDIRPRVLFWELFAHCVPFQENYRYFIIFSQSVSHSITYDPSLRGDGGYSIACSGKVIAKTGRVRWLTPLRRMTDRAFVVCWPIVVSCNHSNVCGMKTKPRCIYIRNICLNIEQLAIRQRLLHFAGKACRIGEVQRLLTGLVARFAQVTLGLELVRLLRWERQLDCDAWFTIINSVTSRNEWTMGYPGTQQLMFAHSGVLVRSLENYG